MKLSYRQREWFTGYAFVLLPVIGAVVLTLYPLIANIYNSFFLWDAINERIYIGFEHFEWMFEKDVSVQTSMKATLKYLMLHVPLVVAGGLFFSLLLNNSRLKGVNIARTAVITPLVTATVAIAAVWLYIFNPNVGLLNTLIVELGGERQNWYGKPDLAMFVLLVVSVWRGIGYSFIFLLAGLQNIPPVYYEAAQIDGANRIQIFRHVTLPLLTPSIFMVLVLVFIGAAQEFELPLVLTGGGPRYATSLINLTIYKNAFSYGQFGYASAIATVTFLFLLVGTIIQFVLQRRWVHYAE